MLLLLDFAGSKKVAGSISLPIFQVNAIYLTAAVERGPERPLSSDIYTCIGIKRLIGPTVQKNIAGFFSFRPENVTSLFVRPGQA